MQKFLEKIQRIKLPKTNRGSILLNAPDTPGVYIFFLSNKPIYIGKATNLKRRLSSYFDLVLQTKTRKMISSATHIGYVQVTSELEALLLEARLIRKHMPQYNIAAKDDKHPLYILITEEKYPRIVTGRKVDVKNKSQLKAYYGPFPSSRNVRFVLRMLRRIFPFSDHKIGKRACLYSEIGLCNPCPSFIERLQDSKNKLRLGRMYHSNIRHLKRIFDGKITVVRKQLEKKMVSLSKLQKYEEAKVIREQLNKLDYIIQPKLPVEYFMENPNLYDDLRSQEINELRNILKKYKLGDRKPTRIECFDVAHLAGSSPTASMVTFIGGEADKNFYRHFRIKQKKADSDVDSLKEVIKRRLTHIDDWGSPDLVIVDGGKPQVGVFMREMSNLKIPVIGIAKRFESLVIPQKSDGTILLREYRLPKGPALNLVQRLRDEAHRFARRYHHKLLSNSILAHENTT